MDGGGDGQRLGPFAAVVGGAGGEAAAVLCVSSVPGLCFQALLGCFAEPGSEPAPRRGGSCSARV